MATDSTDSTDLEPLTTERYDPETVQQALTAVALAGGNSVKARKQLLAAGIDVPESTLKYWRTERFPARYRQACDELAPQIEAAVVGLQRELAVRASSAALDAIDLETDRIANGDVKDAAGSARNLSTSAAIAVDKVLSLTGRPTVIHGDKTGDALLKELRGLAPGLIVNGTIEEPADAEVVEAPPLRASV